MAGRKLELEDITAVIDTREQTPFNLHPLKSIKKKLETGDYSICGLESQVCLERKSLPDLLSSVGKNRPRFNDCIDRMLLYPSRCIVVESTWEYFMSGKWSWMSAVHKNSAIGSILGWIEMGIPIIFAGVPQDASLCAQRFLYLAAKRRMKHFDIEEFHGDSVA